MVGESYSESIFKMSRRALFLDLKALKSAFSRIQKDMDCFSATQI